jgi:uncharacterized membrane protein YhaH (DUF805 family)
MEGKVKVRRLISLLFGFRGVVSRRTYFLSGLALFALKYAGDWALSAVFASHALGIVDYSNPVLSARLSALGAYPSWLPVVMMGWALPFIWIGVSMSARRAVDAGRSPWLSLLFLLPIVNYLLIVLLCALPAGEPAAARLAANIGAPPGADSMLERLKVAALSSLAATSFGALGVVFSVFGMRQYGSALFIGIPFLLGVISGLVLNHRARRSAGATVSVALLSVTLVGGASLLLALEGLLCLAMAAPLAYPLAVLGAILGRALAQGPRPLQPTASLLVAWPLLAAVPWDTAERFPERVVLSSVDIDAPPEHVWPHVIAFPPLPPASEWLMKSGVACPLRATIEGQGVGAVRYCEFTTGPFVEPITAWDPPYRLAFDVASQPPSMREWSPYEVVHAPHLHGGLQSLRGAFQLTRLAGDRTRLEGRTWYRLKMSPNVYWAWYADYAIGVIHHRVLSFIRTLSERP